MSKNCHNFWAQTVEDVMRGEEPDKMLLAKRYKIVISKMPMAHRGKREKEKEKER